MQNNMGSGERQHLAKEEYTIDVLHSEAKYNSPVLQILNMDYINKITYVT